LGTALPGLPHSPPSFGAPVDKRRDQHDRPARIGVELFGTQTASRHRGIGRYSRNLVTALLGRDTVNEYVLYGQYGMPIDLFPAAPNAVVRLLRPDPEHGEKTMGDAMERLTATNPDRLDSLFLLNPVEMAPGYDLPAKPLNQLKMFAVIYDFIPLIYQEEYFRLWPGPESVLRYHQSLSRLQSYDALLAISEATRRDLVSLLGVSSHRVFNIGAASDGRFFIPDRTDPMPTESRKFLAGRGITQPFVFSVGSFEYRKNLWGLIEAFAMLPREMRQGHQLVLTYDLSAGESERVRQYARDHGVAAQLVLTDRLADTGLRILYQRCAAFVFPSSYEGFGLPILEAMHCGAPVVGGNNSSQTEVIGDAGLLFNVADAGELSAQLSRILGQPAMAAELSKRGVAQARRFSWDATARKTLDVLTHSHITERPAPRQISHRRVPDRRIAFFSPFPPLRSEVADDTVPLLDELKSRYSIDLYHDAAYLPHIGFQSSDFGCYDYRLFERNAGLLGYHALIYQVASSPYHQYMYDILRRYPGIVALHDLGVGCSLVMHAFALIVHSSWCADEMRRRFPAELAPMHVVPVGATRRDPSPDERAAIRARFNLPREALVVASIECLHSQAASCEIIAAYAALARAIPAALLIFVGEFVDAGEARRMVTGLELQHRVRFLGYQPGDVVADLAATADIGICLRPAPQNGEMTGALMKLLSLGVPTIVSDRESFSCFPDAAVGKHRRDRDGLAGLSRALCELAVDRRERQALGRAALHYVRANHDWARVADAYEEIIEATAARRAAPRADFASALPRPHLGATRKRVETAR
jgi:glycosyltransferase involved in cell wall biosynthesis